MTRLGEAKRSVGEEDESSLATSNPSSDMVSECQGSLTMMGRRLV